MIYKFLDGITSGGSYLLCIHLGYVQLEINFLGYVRLEQ